MTTAQKLNALADVESNTFLDELARDAEALAEGQPTRGRVFPAWADMEPYEGLWDEYDDYLREEAMRVSCAICDAPTGNPEHVHGDALCYDCASWARQHTDPLRHEFEDCQFHRLEELPVEPRAALVESLQLLFA